MKCFGRRLTPMHVAVASLLGAIGSPALAQESPYSVGFLETIEHDSNVYRAQTGTSGVSSDWISTTGVTGTYAQLIGRSSIKAAGEFDVNRFDRDKTLNSFARSETVDGTWSTVERLSGEWGVADSAQLYRYNPTSTINAATVGVRNLLTIDRGYAGLHLGVVTPLTFDLTGHGLRQKYSAPNYQPLDLDKWDVGAGVTFRSTPDLSVSVSLRHSDGKYPTYGDHFKRNDVVLGLFYVPTGQTQFTAQISRGRETHSFISSRDSSNLDVHAQGVWQATGRTQFKMNFERGDDTDSTGADYFAGTQLSNNQAIRHTAVNGGVYYDLTSKIKANITGSLSHRSLDSAFSAVPELNAKGSDNLYNAGLGLTYMPTRLSQIACNASREKRSTNGSTLGLTYPYAATVFGCTGQIAFN